MYEITKTGKGVVKVCGDKRYHKGLIIGRFKNYILTRCKDKPYKNSAGFQLFRETKEGLEKCNLTLRENREIKARILN